VPSQNLAKLASGKPSFGYMLAGRLALLLYAASFLGGIAYLWATRREVPRFGPGTLERADELERRGDLSGALREYRMLASLQRRNYDFAKKVSELARATGDPSAEVEKYLRAREIWPRDPAVRRSLGNAYVNSGRYLEAVGAFRSALDLKPGDRDAMAALGDALLELDRFAEAAAAFEEAIRAHPDDAALRNSLGVTYALWGRPREAIVHFETAQRLHPSPQFQANLERARQEAASKS
jgi:tetratricopeptide (TPR) repeat protein